MALPSGRLEARWTSRGVPRVRVGDVMSRPPLVSAQHPPGPQCPLGQPEALERPGRRRWRSH